jgi:hypothetical protein
VASPSLLATARSAAATWNLSRTGVRWRRTRGRADVTIAITPGLGVPGRALLAADARGIHRAKIQISPTVASLARSPAERRFLRTLALVHEMGHAMGLDHDTRFCATMQPTYLVGSPAHCDLPEENWRFRCRLLEPDDLAGAGRLFGGSGRIRGPEFCDLVAAPPGAAAATVTARPTGGAEISWRTPADGGLEAVRVLRGTTCPTGPDDRRAQEVDVVRALPGATQKLVDPGAPPNACYAVITLAQFNRPGPVATAQLGSA